MNVLTGALRTAQCLMSLCLLCSTAESGMIDFESFPGGGSPADGVSIRDQYLLSDGVRFGLNGGGEPVLVRTGNTGTNVFVGASGVMDTLLPGEPDIGNFFLHDNGDPLTTPAGFFMRFMDDKAFVSGMVLDVEPRPTGAREAWRITAFDVNDVALEEIVIDGKDRGDSDSEAVPFAFDFDEAIMAYVQIDYIGDVPNPGFGLDNFFVSAEPVPVPEPGSMALLACVGAFGVYRRRRN